MYDYPLFHQPLQSETKPVEKTCLDLIDEEFSVPPANLNLTDIQGMIKLMFNHIGEIISTKNYHTELMSYLGYNHTVTYSTSNNLIRMTIVFKESRIRMPVIQTDDGFAYRCINRQKRCLLSSTDVAEPKPVNYFPASPVNEDRYSFRTDANVFVPPIPLEDVVGFKASYHPKMSMGVLPIFTPKEITYLRHTVDNYGDVKSGVSYSQYIRAIKDFYKFDFHKYFGVLYQWGLVKLENDILHFNMSVIVKILQLLDSIDRDGVTDRDAYSYVGVIDELVQGKAIKKTDMPKKIIPRMLGEDIFNFSKKVKINNRLSVVCSPTEKSIKIYETWVDIYKLVEPYVHQLKHKSI